MTKVIWWVISYGAFFRLLSDQNWGVSACGLSCPVELLEARKCFTTFLFLTKNQKQEKQAEVVYQLPFQQKSISTMSSCNNAICIGSSPAGLFSALRLPNNFDESSISRPLSPLSSSFAPNTIARRTRGLREVIEEVLQIVGDDDFDLDEDEDFEDA